MAEPVALKYRAFISYSHVDTSWAKWLHRALEGFYIDKDLVGRHTVTGEIPRTLRPVFRDREDFTAGHSLNEQTLSALGDSAALIVICSPDSAKSLYVNEEIRVFRTRHPGRRVIPLIVGGKPGDPKLECFPPPLKFKLDTHGEITNAPDDLLAADARDDGDGKDLALAKVVAALLGLSSDDVFHRAERERRTAARRKRRLQVVFASLVVLLAAAGVGWFKQDYLRDKYYWVTAMDPSVLTAKQESELQPQDEFRECLTGCPVMVVVPAGRFMMGSFPHKGPPRTITEEWEYPRHPVEIQNAFAVSKFEVTFDDWNACVAYGDCNPRVSNSGWGHGRQPVATAEWDDAKRYVTWLSRMTGKTYRLLSEAEWEYSARAGTETDYPWGDAIGKGHANCKGCGEERNSTTPAGTFPPNAFGLYDMHGNVEEWVEDTLQYDYEGAPADGSAWVKNLSLHSSRVLRGGDWGNDPIDIRSASRSSSQPEVSHIGTGFRVARTLAPNSDERTRLTERKAGSIPSKVELPPPPKLAGVYRLSATNHHGNKHPGMLAITYAGNFFVLARWIKGQVSHGTAYLTDGHLTVKWGSNGPAIYAVGAKGRLEGKWADGAPAETAEPIGFVPEKTLPAPEGKYSVEGRNADGSSYSGIVTISKQPNGYYVHWEIGDRDYEGKGVFQRNVLTVDYGASTPAIYAIGEGGRLAGLWNSGKGEEKLVPLH